MTDKSLQLIPCDQAVRQLWDYLDGLAGDQPGVEAHLAFCRRCCGELEFIRHLRTLLGSQTADDLPAPAIQRLERFVEELEP